LELTIALNRYDRHIPIFEGSVGLPGVSLKPLLVGESHKLKHGGSRHARTLKDLEFDISEVSLASWVAAVAQNPDLPLVGIPTFPRRFFSQGQIYVGADSTATKPEDLIGRKVGLHSFQTTLSVLAKGDLKREYGIDWRKIHWVCFRPEIINVDLGPDVKIEWLPPEKEIGEMMMSGEIAAFMSPEPRESMLRQTHRYRRLFPDSRGEELRFFKKRGFFPVMHIIAVKRELVQARPDLCLELLELFDEAKREAYRYYDDSDYSLIVWSRNFYEDQRKDLGEDPWVNGLKANYQNLVEFLEDSHDQGLTSSLLRPEALFHESTWNT